MSPDAFAPIAITKPNLAGSPSVAHFFKYFSAACTDKNNEKQKTFANDMKKLIDAVNAVTQEDSENYFQSFIDNNMATHKLPNKTAFYLLDCHPSFCGLATKHILLDSYQKLTYDFAADTGHILAVAHLYNAAKQSKHANNIPQHFQLE
jgi:hypothetical protein